MSCSALKLKYRQVFRTAATNANLCNFSITATTSAVATTTTTAITTPRKLSLSTPLKSSLTTPRKLSLTTTSVIVATTAPKIDPIKLNFLFLSMSEKKAKNLVRARALSTGHFMPATLVSSQFEILELPGEKEKDAHVLDSNVSVEEVKRGALKILEGLIGK